MSPFDYSYPFSPTPSTSTRSPAPSPAGSASTHSSYSPATPLPRKRVACARCRRLKEKCVWHELQDRCERCTAKGVSCSGPAPKQDNGSPSNHKPSQRVLTHRAAFSPYATAAGRPRVLGPSSSEAGLNAVLRARLLRAELLDLYHEMWPVQPIGISPSSILDMISGTKDEASKVLVTMCTAIGARSSNHSEIVQKTGPPLSVVDHLSPSDPTRGGFSEWGLRRRDACVALGAKAVESASAFFRGAPSFRMLTVALVASGLSTTLYGDLAGRREFNSMAVRIWRALLREPAKTTAEERALLHGSIGLVLVGRDLEYTIACGGEPECLPSEQAFISATNKFDATLDSFGIPDCVNHDGFVIFDEVALQTNYQQFQLWFLLSLAPLVSSLTLASFTPANAQALRQLWAINDWGNSQAATKLAQIKQLSPDEVIVLHKWEGRWRPSNPRDHAACLVSEMVADGHDIDSFVYNRLLTEWQAGRFVGAGVDVRGVVDEARERCRLALRDNARATKQWSVLDHKHALLSRVFHYLGNIQGWVELALGRFGEVDGPRTKEAELSLEEVELLVWGLRVGSFSQSSLGVPLREMEEGLERLRQAEVVAAANTVDLDLDQFLVGFDVAEDLVTL